MKNFFSKFGFALVLALLTGSMVYADRVSTGGGSGSVATDSIWTAKGDVVAGTGSATAVAVPVGADGQVLAASSTATAGVAWKSVAGTGDVVGPASATANAIVRYSGTTGKLIKDYTSGAPTVGDTGTLTVSGTSTLATTTATLFTGSGAGTFSSTLAVTGATTLSSTLGVTGTSTLATTTATLFTATGASTLGSLTISNITGVAANCLHVDTNGVVSGIGLDCGSGGSGPGTGTIGTVPYWDTTTTIASSALKANTTLAGVNATSSLYSFLVQGASAVKPFAVASSTGTLLASIDTQGFLQLGASTTIAKLQLSGNATTSLGATGSIGTLLRIEPSTIANSDASTSTIANYAVNAVGIPTLNSATTTTYTVASSLYISGAPAAGTNSSITLPYALNVNAGAATFGGSFNVNGASTFLNSIQNGGSNNTGNFQVAAQSAVSSQTSQAQAIFSNTLNTTYRTFFGASATSVLTAAASHSNVIVGSAAVTEASSGNHPWINALTVKAVPIIGAAATVGNTASIFIEGASTTTVSGANYSFAVASSTATSTITYGFDNVEHTITGGGTPTVASCGSAPSPTILGNDRNFRVLVGGSAATSCTITFAAAYTSNPPVCTFTQEVGTAVGVVASSTLSTVVLTGTTIASDQFVAHCERY